ncbi:MAG: hypothetical protein V7606_1618 [Burkholderiales bacterium]|jgi:hypothetical protein
MTADGNDQNRFRYAPDGQSDESPGRIQFTDNDSRSRLVGWTKFASLLQATSAGYFTSGQNAAS